jgi:hypothetical protein
MASCSVTEMGRVMMFDLLGFNPRWFVVQSKCSNPASVKVSELEATNVASVPWQFEGSQSMLPVAKRHPGTGSLRHPGAGN